MPSNFSENTKQSSTSTFIGLEMKDITIDEVQKAKERSNS